MRVRHLSFLLAAALSTPVTFATPAIAAGKLDVVQLAVGQGDAALFRGACGDIGLIDAGDGSANAIVSQLDSWGTSIVDWAAVTHYDSDHLGDMQQLGDSSQAGGSPVEIPVIYDRGGGASAKDTQTYAAYDAWLTSEHWGERIAVDIGDVLTLCSGEEEVTFTVVSAGTDGTAADGIAVTEENDRGLCFHVEFGDFDMATCGDVNGTDEGSRTNVEQAVADDLGDVEVLKANHHGSAYSSSAGFLAVVQPDVTIISVGDNSYGHPDPGAVSRLSGYGDVFTTNSPADGTPVDGNVAVTTDGVSGFLVTTSASSVSRSYGLDGAQEPPPPPSATVPEARAIDHSCPAGSFSDDGFIDLPDGATHETAVDCLVWWEVAKGVTATRYMPSEGVSRAAMATFVARAIGKTGGYLPTTPANYFWDDNGNTHELAINQLAQLGIVSGTGGGGYNPTATVNRGQMAKFLAGAAAHVLGAPLPASSDYFKDDNGNTFEPFINQVAQAGLTGGRPDGTYGLTGAVTRAQMGSFMARLLDLLVEAGHGATPPATSTPPGPQPPANPGDSKNCGDFATWREAQNWFDYYYPYYGDVARLDSDGDRVACESLPGAP